LDVSEILEYLLWVLDMELSPTGKDQLATELNRVLLTENRGRAERRGIGLESRLTPKVLYSVAEYVAGDEQHREEGD
jgi:hypothetical protein